MALALLEREDGGGEAVRFRFDIGRNRYYRYLVGGKDRTLANGLPVLEEVSYESPILGPVPEHRLGRGVLAVPREQIDKDHQYVQLISYRTEDRIGPAVSEPARAWRGRTRSGVTDLEDLPVLEFARESEAMEAMIRPRVENVPFAFQEGKYSNAMFVEALVGMLPQLLPAVAPMLASLAPAAGQVAGQLLGPLLGNLTGAATGQPADNQGNRAAVDQSTQALLRTIGDPETVKQITELVARLGELKSTGKAPASQQGLALQRSYSEAQAVPAALLTALPQLLPLLKQVLTPETVKGLINAPNRHLGTVINGLKDISKLALQSHEQDLRHLRELTPSVDDPALDQLLASLSLGLSRSTQELRYKRVPSVKLRFEGTQTQILHGHTRVLYGAGRALSFPMSLDTPRTIREATIQLVVKDPDTLDVLAEARQSSQNINSGPLPVVPRLDESQVANLAPNQEYLVCVNLMWPNSRGDARGTSLQQKIMLVGDFSFDRVEQTSDMIPLEDVTRFREFWHKVWSGPFTEDVRRYIMDCKYYCVLDLERETNARIETRTRLQEMDGSRVGRLKSGMELSLYSLNRLIPQLTSGAMPLSQPELDALTSPDFVNRFNQAARYKATLRGRAGKAATLWVWPEVKLQPVVLQRAAGVDPNGLVTQLSEHVVNFPMPVLLHFQGMRT